jgi:diguanylate cyclase (GGDEF)-like protein
VIVFHDVARSSLMAECMSHSVCRRGGGEFVILLSEIECRRDAARVAENMLAGVREPQVIDGHAVGVSATIGISLYLGNGGDIDALMRRADVAMYQAKACGPDGGYRFAGA